MEHLYRPWLVTLAGSHWTEICGDPQFFFPARIGETDTCYGYFDEVIQDGAFLRVSVEAFTFLAPIGAVIYAVNIPDGKSPLGFHAQ